MTTATIAVLLEDIISRAHRQHLPQYQVFSLFSADATVVSFNWDGLAMARCPQKTVLHPHGVVVPTLRLDRDLDDLLFETQLVDDGGARDWYLPGLVLPGEETGPALSAMREDVLGLWLSAPTAVVIGYSFGTASDVAYDRVWLDSFAEAFSRNCEAPIHILSPDAARVCEIVRERVGRRVNVVAWPYRWDLLSTALLRACKAHSGSGSAALLLELGDFASILRDLDQRAEEAG